MDNNNSLHRQPSNASDGNEYVAINPYMHERGGQPGNPPREPDGGPTLVRALNANQVCTLHVVIYLSLISFLDYYDNSRRFAGLLRRVGHTDTLLSGTFGTGLLVVRFFRTIHMIHLLKLEV